MNQLIYIGKKRKKKKKRKTRLNRDIENTSMVTKGAEKGVWEG